MVRAILFDLGNVLVPFELSRGYAAFAQLTGLDANAVAQRLSQTNLYSEYEAGQLSTAEFHTALCQTLGCEIPLAQLREAWNAIFHPTPSTSPELLAALKRNYRLVLLSNTNELHFGWLREHYPLLDLFDDYTLSFEAKAMKPDPRIYSDAIARAQCSPAECFYTDDIPRYVEAARSHGIRAEQFTGEANLRAHLAAHGISFYASAFKPLPLSPWLAGHQAHAFAPVQPHRLR
jgi:putative hydrolase of the HAD superfamily